MLIVEPNERTRTRNMALQDARDKLPSLATLGHVVAAARGEPRYPMTARAGVLGRDVAPIRTGLPWAAKHQPGLPLPATPCILR